jgi:prevent-host-death family protein
MATTTKKKTDVVKTITAMKARKNFGALLEEVYYKGGQYVVERAGKPMAAVVPVGQLEAQRNRRDTFFAAIDTIRKRNRKVGAKKIADEVSKSVRAVRHLVRP